MSSGRQEARTVAVLLDEDVPDRRDRAPVLERPGKTAFTLMRTFQPFAFRCPEPRLKVLTEQPTLASPAARHPRSDTS